MDGLMITAQDEVVLTRAYRARVIKEGNVATCRYAVTALEKTLATSSPNVGQPVCGYKG